MTKLELLRNRNLIQLHYYRERLAIRQLRQSNDMSLDEYANRVNNVKLKYKAVLYDLKVAARAKAEFDCEEAINDYFM